MTDVHHEAREATRVHIAALEGTLRELRKLHPENCTTAFLMELRGAYLREMEQHLNSLRSYLDLHEMILRNAALLNTSPDAWQVGADFSAMLDEELGE